MLGVKLSIIFLILFCSFSVILPSPISPMDSGINQPPHDESNVTNYHKNESPEDSLKDKIIVGLIVGFITLIAGLFFGFFSNFLLYKKTLKIRDIVNRYNEIRSIFIYYCVQIKNLKPNQDIEAGDIVVESINKTDILIQKLILYIGDGKTKKIIRHYNEYKKPYETEHNVIVMLKGLRQLSGNPDDKSFSYSNNKPPDARKIALKQLRILIKDFERV